jgi:hypothetical protein
MASIAATVSHSPPREMLLAPYTASHHSSASGASVVKSWISPVTLLECAYAPMMARFRCLTSSTV